MINLLFYIGVAVVSLIIVKGIFIIDEYVDRILFRLRIQEDTLSNQNWFLKYELYRKGVNGNAKKTGDI